MTSLKWRAHLNTFAYNLIVLYSLWLYPYSSGLHHWNRDICQINTGTVKQPWGIWLKMTINKPHQISTKQEPCVYFMGCADCKHNGDLAHSELINPLKAGTQGCTVSPEATDALVLKHQGISIHRADKIFILLGQFHTEIFHWWWQNDLDVKMLNNTIPYFGGPTMNPQIISDVTDSDAQPYIYPKAVRLFNLLCTQPSHLGKQ